LDLLDEINAKMIALKEEYDKLKKQRDAINLGGEDESV